MIRRAFRYRLEPTAEQAELFEQFAGVTRFVYNLALEQRMTYWRCIQDRTGYAPNYISQGKEVTQLRAEVEWIAAAPARVLAQALRDLDRAFVNFFSRRAAFPGFRKRGRNDNFRFLKEDFRTKRLNGKWSAVQVPKAGWVKFRDTRPMRGNLGNLTVTKAADGWYACFASQIEHESPANDLPAVGIDRGIANTLALSTGEFLSTPGLAHLERRKKRAQRLLARRVRGSNRYRKQRQRAGRIAAKIARCRADWRHKASLNVARRFGLVAIEDLRTVSMVRANRGLGRAIHEQGWRAFETVVKYKLEERGGTLVKVNPAYTSQTCSDCGTIDKASRKSQASFACRSCGFVVHADTNAAINILRRGTASMRAEGGGYVPVEARTLNLAA